MIVQPSILRKALAAFSAIAIVSQAVFAPFADAAYFTLYQLSIKYNGTTYSGSFGATPGSTLEILAAGMNEDETATNVAMNFTFSSTDITYVNPGTVDIYNGETLIRSDVSTLDFNPPNDNSIPLAATSETYDYFQVYYVGIGIPSDFSDYTFTVSSQISAD
ncbi:MAG TPA: hypothetical protein PK765_04065 [bacterium]|nr:hypothetical protein [bacterium]